MSEGIKAAYMRHRLRLLAARTVAATLLIAAPAVFAQQAPTVAVSADARTAPLDLLIPPGPSVTVGELANGLRYFIRESQEPENRAVMRLVIRVGSIVEDDDQLGLAHVLEHMAFNGSENFEKQELVDFMESIGMRLGMGVNASTSFDETIYRLEVPMDDPVNLTTAFQILEDWAHGLTLDPAEVDQERGVVIEEWRLRRGAASRLQDQQFPVIFRGSQYAERNPIGTVESIETFEDDALRRFYEDWYRPDLMGLIAVGDFDASTVEDLVIQHFDRLQAAPNPREREEYPVPDHEETLFSILTDPEVSSTSVTIYHKMDLGLDWTVGGYRQRLIEGMYNNMLNDRFQEIALEPDAPFLSASSSRGQFVRSKGVYSLRASVLEDRIEDGMRALFREAERVARFGFTEAELERQKTAQLRGIEQALTTRFDRSSDSFTSEYTRAFLDGESIPGIEYEYELYQRFIPEITLQEVNRVGRDWITEANRVVLVTGPDNDDVVLPDEASLTRVLASIDDEEITPYEETLTSTELLTNVPEGAPVVDERERDRGITEWILENGVRVILRPTDYEEDEVLFRGFSPGGTSLAPDEDLIPAHTSAELISSGGLGEFDAIDLGRVLTGTVAGASPFISEFEEGVAGFASTADLETMFQLIFLTFTSPRPDEDFFQVWTTQTRQALENRDANPRTAWSDTYLRLMTQDHPRRRPMTVQRLEETDLFESLEFYEDRFADAGDFTFVFVGDLELETMRPLVERYLGGLAATGRVESWRDVGVRAPEGVFEETVFKGLEPQSQTLITFNGPFEYDNQIQRSALRALALALDDQLQEVVREELGGSYSVGVGPGYGWRPEEVYQMSIQFGSDPERADELVEAIFQVLDEFKASGPTEEQAANAREALLRQFETDFQENRTWLSQLVNDYQRGVEPAAAVDTFEASVEALTADVIRDAARQYLDTDNYVRVTLMPE